MLGEPSEETGLPIPMVGYFFEKLRDKCQHDFDGVVRAGGIVVFSSGFELRLIRMPG